MPDITIEQSTFERLQRHARPLVDTTDTVVNSALDALEDKELHVAIRRDHAASERQIDPRTLPNLKHAKVLDASLEGERIIKPNWNLLLNEMLVRAMKRLSDFDKLRSLCPVNMVRGRKEDEGYGYLSEIDVSVQGLDANGACRALVMAAQGLGIGLDIGFMWRHNEGAAYPGEKARLIVPEPKSESNAVAA